MLWLFSLVFLWNSQQWEWRCIWFVCLLLRPLSPSYLRIQPQYESLSLVPLHLVMLCLVDHLFWRKVEEQWICENVGWGPRRSGKGKLQLGCIENKQKKKWKNINLSKDRKDCSMLFSCFPLMGLPHRTTEEEDELSPDLTGWAEVGCCYWRPPYLSGRGGEIGGRGSEGRKGIRTGRGYN